MNTASLTSPKPMVSALKISAPIRAVSAKRRPAPRPVATPAHHGWLKMLTARASPIAGKITRSRMRRCSRSKKTTCTRTRPKTLCSSSSHVAPSSKPKAAKTSADAITGPQTCQGWWPGSRPSSFASRTEPQRTSQPHAAPTTATAPATSTWLNSRPDSLRESLAHGLERGGLSGPDLEGARALREENSPPVGDAQPQRARLAHQRRAAPDVDEVDDRATTREGVGPQGHLLAPAQGCGVQQEVGRPRRPRPRRIGPRDHPPG